MALHFWKIAKKFYIKKKWPIDFLKNQGRKKNIYVFVIQKISSNNKNLKKKMVKNSKKKKKNSKKKKRKFKNPDIQEKKNKRKILFFFLSKRKFVTYTYFVIMSKHSNIFLHNLQHNVHQLTPHIQSLFLI